MQIIIAETSQQIGGSNTRKGNLLAVFTKWISSAYPDAVTFELASSHNHGIVTRYNGVTYYTQLHAAAKGFPYPQYGVSLHRPIMALYPCDSQGALI
jgi:hypothetical protein